jgi:hypothetical protein
LPTEPAPTPVDNQIVVFISSHQKEFQELRDFLKDTLEGEDFLKKLLIKVELVERRSGERISGDIALALRDATIYVGLFGNKHSQITIAEYLEARRRGLPLLIFDMIHPPTRRKRRSHKVKEFVESQVRKLDGCRVTSVLFQPSRMTEAAESILQRIANNISEMVNQNLEIRKKIHSQ